MQATLMNRDGYNRLNLMNVQESEFGFGKLAMCKDDICSLTFVSEHAYKFIKNLSNVILFVPRREFRLEYLIIDLTSGFGVPLLNQGHIAR